ncbi:D-alanyl-D-alanine carboxypeptidase/D-alanyl-D-alanine endopeptidase [Nocardiopsis endophytica]
MAELGTKRSGVLLALAMLTIFVLVTGFVAADLVASRPLPAVPYPVAHAQQGTAAHLPGADPVDPGRLADHLDDPMSDSGSGEGLSAYVADAATGEGLFDRDAGRGAVPASTTKIATALTVLEAAGPDRRIATDAVLDGERLILVGGGDPTLTRDADPGAYPEPATLDRLAESTARALEEQGVGAVDLGYDDTLYPGPATGPGWKDNYVWEGSVAPVHALMIDGGRENRDEKYGDRVDDPPRAAADAFADALRDEGVEVRGGPEPVTAPDGAEPVASVSSPPISALTEQMLLASENNVAEALARQTAIAEGEEPSFQGGSRAMTDVLDRLGIGGVELSDASGLSVDNRISPHALADMLLAASDPERPDLSYVLSGLPTGNFSGTLASRYDDSSGAGAGAGVVRAKTGTLSGVSTLAGTVYDADGRLLVFAFMSSGDDASASSLDELAAAVASCGCS